MKRLKNFLLLLYLLTLIFGCQPDDETASGLPETAATAAANLPSPTAEPSPQPTNTAPPTIMPQPTSTPQPTATPTAVPVDWSSIRNGATMLYYYDKDLWRSDIDGSGQQPLTEGDLLASWDLESVEDKWWTGTFMPRPFVSPDGRFIAFTQTGRNMVIIDVSNPTPPRTLSSGSILMAWSPDSRYLAYGRTNLYLYDTLIHRSRDISPIMDRGVHNITWSPDGRYIFLNHYYPGLSPIWRLPADGASTPELIIENAFLLDVVPKWQAPGA